MSLITLGLCLGLMAACSGPDDPSASDAPHTDGRYAGAFVEPVVAEADRFQRAVIPDNSGFDRPMPAITLDIPADWQASGAVVWQSRSSCQAVVPSISWQAVAPDGRTAYEILPRWASQTPGTRTQYYRGCPTAPITSAREFLQALAADRRPGAQIIDYRDRPDLQAMVVVPPDSVLAGISEIRYHAEAGDLLIGWSEDGVAMREVLSAPALIIETATNLAMSGIERSVAIGVDGATAFRAPEGELDLDLLIHMQHSGAPVPEWAARLGGHQATMNRIATEGAIAVSRERARGMAEASAIRNQTWSNVQAMRDAGHARTIDAIREVQPYVDPYRSTPVELSNQYKYTWRLSDGRYYQTDNPSFNPYRELGIDGEQLQAAGR